MIASFLFLKMFVLTITATLKKAAVLTGRGKVTFGTKNQTENIRLTTTFSSMIGVLIPGKQLTSFMITLKQLSRLQEQKKLRFSADASEQALPQHI